MKITFNTNCGRTRLRRVLDQMNYCSEKIASATSKSYPSTKGEYVFISNVGVQDIQKIIPTFLQLIQPHYCQITIEGVL